MDMGEKKSAYLNIGVICAIILTFMIADLMMGDRLYSETENRMLASRPKFSLEALLDGSYTADYEAYVTDQFVSRDKWVAIKTCAEILLGKTEVNGVYLGARDYLIEQHLPQAYPEELIEDKLKLLNMPVEKWDAKVMLIPTADNIISDKLPAYAPYFDQRMFLDRVREYVGEDHYIEVYDKLAEHSQEYIYYQTDHHWTTLGAYYGYHAWAEDMGEEPFAYNLLGMERASENFRGTLHSKTNLGKARDTLLYFPETVERPVSLIYDKTIKRNSYYEEKYLDTKNQYGFFLDDNHALAEIHTGYENGRTLFVIKDSYANCFIPLLTPHYERIYVLDPRYFNGKLEALLRACEPENGMEVLILYNCIHFLEDFDYYE